MSDKEELYIPGLIDTRKNPLEVLGLNEELVEALGVEALKVAVAGVHRAWAMSLHPDLQEPDENPKIKRFRENKWTKIEEAYQRTKDESLADVREAFLAQKREERQKARGGKKLTRPTGAPIITSNVGKGVDPYIAGKLVEASIGRSDIEHVKQIRSAEILVSSSQNIFKGFFDSPNDAIMVYQDGKLSHYTTASHKRKLKGPISEVFPRPGETLDSNDVLHVEDGVVRQYRSDKGGVSSEWAEFPELEGTLEDGWHIIRGIRTKEKDNRLMLSFTRIVLKRELGLELVGSIGQDAWVQLGRRKKNQLDRYEQIEKGADASPSLPLVPSLHPAENLLTFGYFDMFGAIKEEQWFQPAIRDSYMLIGHLDAPMPANMTLFPIGHVKAHKTILKS